MIKGRSSAVLAILAAVGLLICGQPVALAQERGTIYGTVLDNAGAAVERATVTVINEQTRLKREVLTGEDGDFIVPALPVGVYSVEVSAPGFAPFRESGIPLGVNQNIRVAVVLVPATITEEVTITGVTNQVETRTPTLGQLVEERRINDLPLNGRNFLELGPIQAGVAPPIANQTVALSGTNDTPGGTRFTFQVNGLRNSSNNFLLDGVNNVDPNTGSAMVVPAPDMLTEFKIQTSLYEAEYGRGGGSIVNVVTRSGTNALHGSVYHYLRNEKLDARNFFSARVPKLRQNQFGFTLGGPIARDRAFFFGSYEGYRLLRGLPTDGLVPSNLERVGDFSQSLLKPVDPITGRRFPDDRIPAERIHPIASRIIPLWPRPNVGSNIFRSEEVQDVDRDLFLVRGDMRLTENQTITGRYAFDDRQNAVPIGLATTFGPITVPGFGFTDSTRFQNLLIGDTWVASSSVVNEFRFSYQHARFDSQIPNSLGDRSQFGFTFADTNNLTSAPNIAIVGASPLFWTAFITRTYNIFDFKDDLSWQRRRHSLKFGFESRYSRIPFDAPGLTNGTFRFTGSVTGNAFADFLLGRPFLFIQLGGQSMRRLRQTAYYWYAQDTWRVSPRVTLSLGIRQEIVPWFKDLNKVQVLIAPGQKSTVDPRLPTGILLIGDPGVPDRLVKTKKDAFAPRLGLAWDVFGTGKTSLRAGYGIFYDETVQLQILQLTNPPGILTNINVVGPTNFADPYNGNSPFAGGRVPVPPGVATRGPTADATLPYVQQWNLSLQQTLPSSFIVEAAYVGTHALHLLGTRDANQPINGVRPIAGLSRLDETTTRYRSSYHGLQMNLSRRFSRGLGLLTSYTFSKVLDETSKTNQFHFIPGQANFPQDNYNVRLDRGRAAFDVRHRFVLSALWEVPWMRGRASWPRVVFGNWQVTGLLSLQTGFPFTVLDGSDPNANGLDGDRPDLVANAALPSDRRTADRWFNTGAFARFARGSKLAGTAPRNFLDSDGIKNIDLGLIKHFPIKERADLEFRAEFFNLFNHVNFGTPVNDIVSPAFGRVLQTSAPERQVQFALKLTF